MKEETNDEVYLKYHNFFEKKEKEYRNKIREYFGRKKIQKTAKEQKSVNDLENIIDNNIYDDNNNNINKSNNSNIIKIILRDEKKWITISKYK